MLVGTRSYFMVKVLSWHREIVEESLRHAHVKLKGSWARVKLFKKSENVLVVILGNKKRM